MYKLLAEVPNADWVISGLNFMCWKRQKMQTGMCLKLLYVSVLHVPLCILGICNFGHVLLQIYLCFENLTPTLYLFMQYCNPFYIHFYYKTSMPSLSRYHIYFTSTPSLKLFIFGASPTLKCDSSANVVQMSFLLMPHPSPTLTQRAKSQQQMTTIKFYIISRYL